MTNMVMQPRPELENHDTKQTSVWENNGFGGGLSVALLHPLRGPSKSEGLEILSFRPKQRRL
jgi:hypothetical protein